MKFLRTTSMAAAAATLVFGTALAAPVPADLRSLTMDHVAARLGDVYASGILNRRLVPKVTDEMSAEAHMETARAAKHAHETGKHLLEATHPRSPEYKDTKAAVDYYKAAEPYHQGLATSHRTARHDEIVADQSRTLAILIKEHATNFEKYALEKLTGKKFPNS